MKFRWRGGTKGFIARSGSRFVRRELSRNNGGERTGNSCAAILIIAIGVPLALALLRFLSIPFALIFNLFEKYPWLLFILCGMAILGILILFFLQRGGFIKLIKDWGVLKINQITKLIKKMSSVQLSILTLLVIITVILVCCISFAVYIIIST